jgi:hypothetical protein
MVNAVRVWRHYMIVSTRGTQGTYLQRLLVFTTARRKAPGTLLDVLLRRFHVDLQVVSNHDQAAQSPG